MNEVDYERIEVELDLVVPNIYKMFMSAVQSKGIELKKYGISYDTETIIAGNINVRLKLAENKPKWKTHYFDFGLGDGCGNYFFLKAKSEDDDKVQLWAHDPSGIESVSSATKFFGELLAEAEASFNGPNRHRFEGNGFET